MTKVRAGLASAVCLVLACSETFFHGSLLEVPTPSRSAVIGSCFQGFEELRIGESVRVHLVTHDQDSQRPVERQIRRPRWQSDRPARQESEQSSSDHPQGDSSPPALGAATRGFQGPSSAVTRLAVESAM